MENYVTIRNRLTGERIDIMFEAIILFLALSALSVSAVFGIRWRKEKNILIREIIKSKQNISMGLMSLLIALFFFINVTSIDLRFFVACFMLLLGLVNSVQGIRMYRHYIKQLTNS